MPHTPTPDTHCPTCGGRGWYRRDCTKPHGAAVCYELDCLRLRKCPDCNSSAAIPKPPEL